MQKEKTQILLNAIAELVVELIPEGKAKTTLAMEYGMSPAEMSNITNAKKDLKLVTFIMLAEILEISLKDFSGKLKEKLPADFRLTEI